MGKGRCAEAFSYLADAIVLIVDQFEHGADQFRVVNLSGLAPFDHRGFDHVAQGFYARRRRTVVKMIDSNTYSPVAMRRVHPVGLCPS